MFAPVKLSWNCSFLPLLDSWVTDTRFGMEHHPFCDKWHKTQPCNEYITINIGVRQYEILYIVFQTHIKNNI